MAYTLTINSLLLSREGFCWPLDLTDLMQRGEMRGSDFVAQGVAGETFRPKVRGALRALVPLELDDEVDSTGSAHATRGWPAIRKNAQAIDTACVAGSASSLVTLSLVYDDAVTQTAQVYCPRLDVNFDTPLGKFTTAVLEVVIPAGQLT